MKKFLKVVAVLLTIVNICILALLIISLTKPEAFGQWAVDFYEELTSEVGHTVEGMYRRLLTITVIAGCVSLGLSTITVIVTLVAYCKAAQIAVDAELEAVEIKKEAQMTKEEKQAMKLQKKAEKRAAREQKRLTVKKVNETTEIVDAAVNGAKQNTETINSFIESLKKYRG